MFYVIILNMLLLSFKNYSFSCKLCFTLLKRRCVLIPPDPCFTLPCSNL